jgi:lysophospholipase L1-like esterase
MQPINEKVLRRKKRRRKLFLWRAAVCLCLLSLLAAVAEGTTAVIRDFSGGTRSASSRASSGPSASPQAAAVSRRPEASSSRKPEQPSSVPAPKGWFADALFIGDSRTEGLRNYDGLSGATYYAVKGLMVNTVYTRSEIPEDGTKKTVMAAQAAHPFGKIYVMLGVNELGWSSMQSFVSDYKKMVADLKKDHPKARVYLQAIFPVSAQKSADSSIYKNDKIASYNRAIQKIADQENVVYLDTAQAVSANGVLPDDASTDGVHLNAEYCAKWCGYLKTHTE